MAEYDPDRFEGIRPGGVDENNTLVCVHCGDSRWQVKEIYGDVSVGKGAKIRGGYVHKSLHCASCGKEHILSRSTSTNRRVF